MRTKDVPVSRGREEEGREGGIREKKAKKGEEGELKEGLAG
jgi:hypothetical protein